MKTIIFALRDRLIVKLLIACASMLLGKKTREATPHALGNCPLLNSPSALNFCCPPLGGGGMDVFWNYTIAHSEPKWPCLFVNSFRMPKSMCGRILSRTQISHSQAEERLHFFNGDMHTVVSYYFGCRLLGWKSITAWKLPFSQIVTYSLQVIGTILPVSAKFLAP